MSSRTVLAVIAAALIFGAIGYYYGKLDLSEEPYASATAVTARRVGPPTCRASATVTYYPKVDSPPAVARFEVVPDKIETYYPATDGAKWAVCWSLVVNGSDPTPFSFIRLDGIDSLKGETNKRVLFGDTNLKDKQGAAVYFNDKPKWNGGSEVKVKYSVVAELSDGTPVTLDPDVIIKKPPSGITQ
jgi:hypothetical protein